MAGSGWWRPALLRAGSLLRLGFKRSGRRRLHSSSASPRGAGGGGAPPVSELDKADAWLLRKAHETGFLSWFRNGLLATGIGVISFVQSDVGQEAAYGFFILGGVCVSYGSASYLANLVMLRRTMMLSVSAAMLSGAAVLSLGLFWVCAISLYIGRLEVEIVRDDTCEDCRDKKDGGRPDK
ncbi:transmembrane protein 160 [Lissotriton helveticus]